MIVVISTDSQPTPRKGGGPTSSASFRVKSYFYFIFLFAIA